MCACAFGIARPVDACWTNTGVTIGVYGQNTIAQPLERDTQRENKTKKERNRGMQEEMQDNGSEGRKEEEKESRNSETLMCSQVLTQNLVSFYKGVGFVSLLCINTNPALPIIIGRACLFQ